MSTWHEVKVVAMGLAVTCVAALLCAGWAAAGPGSPQGLGVPRASVFLADASGTLSQTSDTAWKLTKTGTVDTTTKTVTWTITATQGATVAGHLVVAGFLIVGNTGGAAATIGNIVVNLQTREGTNWVTRSSDVADATHGDAATTAKIDAHASSEDLGTFTENSASGSLKFMDAKTNTMFSLVPRVTLAPGAALNLLFAAAFDNNVLKLPVGTPVRAEVIVSFGNSTSHFPSAPNVDINGNGLIDADEAWVRSVPSRLGLTVPAQQATNANPTITDASSDIATTGTVTFSNATFTIGPTTGTVSVHYDGGTSGGSITNCAHLTGTGSTTMVGGFQFPIVSGVSLQACNTQSIGATTCTPGTAGCGWKDGDVKTYGQGSWSTDPAVNAIVVAHFFNVYLFFEVGIPGSAGFSMTFNDDVHLTAYLPASGVPGRLTADLNDPISSSSGAFGGDVSALKLNVDFADAGFTSGSAPVRFGDLTICGLTTTPGYNGSSVRQYLAAANTALGGGAAAYSYVDLDALTANLNVSFDGGSATSFAQDHLVNGACP